MHQLTSKRASLQGLPIGHRDLLRQVESDPEGSFSALLERLGSASFDEIQKTLDEREAVSPESELTPEVVARLQHLGQVVP